MKEWGEKQCYFTVNLNDGKYVLLAIATWLPEKNQEKVTGYAMYSYVIDVITEAGNKNKV